MPRPATVYAATGAPGKIFAMEAGGKAAGDLGLGRQARGVADLRRRQAPLRRHVEEAIFFKRRRRRPGRGAGGLRCRGGAGAGPRQGGALYAAVNDFERTGSPLFAAGGRRPPRHQGDDRRLRARRLRRARCPVPVSARPRPRFTASTATGGWSRCSRSATATSPRWPSTTSGRAYVGTGSDGRVFRVAADRTAALAIDVPERQALTLVRAGKGFLVGTGDVGSVYRAEPAASKPGDAICRACSTANSGRAGDCSAGTARTRRDREPVRQHGQAGRDLDRVHAHSRSRTRQRRAASGG